MIRRVLQADGYEVDDASSLAEARQLGPDRYDVLLVDDNIGPERGVDLVLELQERDPAAADRCLVITGGARELPDGITCLHKPFGRSQLLDAVRERQRAIAASPAGPASRPPIPTGPASRPPIPGPRAAPPAPSGPSFPPDPQARQPRTAQLLGITRELRTRERQELSDFLHDGPIQEVTATTLELQLMRNLMPPAQAANLDAALRRLDAAAGSLRWLVSGDWPPARPAADLTAALRQQTGWLLAVPLAVNAGPTPEPPTAAEIPVIADVVELMLLPLVPPGMPARAQVTVLTDGSQIRIGLAVGPASDDQPADAPPGAGESVARLASALGAADVRSDLGSRPWRAQLTLVRREG